MFDLIIVAIVNLIVGGLIGISGIAGFLLPMTYAAYFNMPVAVSLMLSFLAFLISGSIGSYNYHKKGNLDIRFSFIIGIGSFAGAIAGVQLNLLIPGEAAKRLLYVVVLLSGISILLRREKADKTADTSGNNKGLLDNKVLVILIGVITGAICSLSGAGGPILVMPLLVMMGMNIRTAIGVALFDSLFIALPAFAGYVTQCDLSVLWGFIIVSALCHGIGVLAGSKNAHKVPQRPLKIAVAVFSVLIACYMLFLA